MGGEIIIYHALPYYFNSNAAICCANSNSHYWPTSNTPPPPPPPPPTMCIFLYELSEVEFELIGKEKLWELRIRKQYEGGKDGGNIDYLPWCSAILFKNQFYFNAAICYANSNNHYWPTYNAPPPPTHQRCVFSYMNFLNLSFYIYTFLLGVENLCVNSNLQFLHRGCFIYFLLLHFGIENATSGQARSWKRSPNIDSLL